VTESTAIVFTRHRGHGITVDEAPPRARMDLQVLADRYAYLHMTAPDVIVFADQVVYRITGYTDGALELELVEDWRPAPTVQTPLTDEQAEEIKTQWKEKYATTQAMHPVVVLNEEKPDA
jgi:aminoglycoside/choline kinase family phosphotransferase